MMSSVMPSAKYSCSGSSLKFRNGRTAIARRSSNRAVAVAVDTDRSANVLEVLRTEIDEVEINLTHNPIVDRSRNVDAARLREGLEAGCNVDSIPEEIAFLDDDVVQIDPDTEHYPPVGQQCLVYSRTYFNQDNRAAHSLDDARELSKYLIAGPLNDASTKFADLRLNIFGPQGGQTGEATRLISRLEQFVTGEQDRRETAPYDPCSIL